MLTRKAKCIYSLVLSGNNSVVECNLAKVDVASSNLVSRSIFFLWSFNFDLTLAPSPSGKAEVCKISISGSNPEGASIFSSDAGVAEVVDARDLKSLGIQSCTGSSPVSGTTFMDN